MTAVRTVLDVWVPWAGGPLPEGDQKIVPSGGPVTGSRLAAARGPFVLGFKDGARTGWRAKSAWSNDRELKRYRSRIGRLARDAWGARPALDAEVLIACTFVFPWLKKHRGKDGKLRPKYQAMLDAGRPVYKISAPDYDKLLRAVGDALEKSGILKNDARIVGLYGGDKRYGDHPGVNIQLAVLAEEKA